MGPEAASDLALVRGQLLRASRCVRHGDVPQARDICAELVLDCLPCFGADRDLLVQLVAVLLHTGAYGLLDRLLRATTGCTARVLSVLRTGAARSPSPVEEDQPCGLLPHAEGTEAVRIWSERVVSWAYREAAMSRAGA